MPSAEVGHSSGATTAAIYSHAIRGKDRAAAQVWDDIMQQSLGKKGGRQLKWQRNFSGRTRVFLVPLTWRRVAGGYWQNDR